MRIHCDRKIRPYVMAGFCATVLFTAACSGGSSGTSTTTTDTDSTASTVTVSGSAQAPATTNSNVTALTRGGILMLGDETEVPMADTAYTIDNASDSNPEPIATGTTDADGNFAAEIDESLVEEGDDLVITVGNMTLHVEYEGDADGDGEFNAGDCDLDSHMAWMDILDMMEGLGYADYTAVNFDDIDFGMDLGCYQMMTEAMWNDDDVAITGEGIAGNAAMMEYMHAAAALAGGFDSRAISNDGLTDAEEDQLFAHVEHYFGINADTVANAYAAAVAADDAIENALALLAQGSQEIGTTTLLGDEGVNFCGEFAADPAQLAIMMDNLQDCGSTDELIDMWGDENSLMAYWDFHETVTDWSTFNQDAFLGSWASTINTYSGDGAIGWDMFDPSQFHDVYSYVATEFAFDDGGDYYSMAFSYCGGYYDDVEEYYGSGASGPFDYDSWYTETGEGYAGFMYGQVHSAGFDATNPNVGYDTYDWGGLYEEHAGDYDYSGCIDNPEACAAYVPEIEDFYYYEAPPPGENGEVAECGDYMCDYDLGETSYSCSIDCGYYYMPPEDQGGDSYGYCGDGVCSEMETAYASCSHDCGGGEPTPMP